MWANKFIDGYKKTIAEKKAKGIMSITEGRSSLSYAGYNAICQAMMTMQPIGRRFTFSEGLFAWPYMILSWNLMSRYYRGCRERIVMACLTRHIPCCLVNYMKIRNTDLVPKW